LIQGIVAGNPMIVVVVVAHFVILLIAIIHARKSHRKN
jgi:hypothetical protein